MPESSERVASVAAPWKAAQFGFVPSVSVWTGSFAADLRGRPRLSLVLATVRAILLLNLD